MNSTSSERLQHHLLLWPSKTTTSSLKTRTPHAATASPPPKKLFQPTHGEPTAATPTATGTTSSIRRSHFTDGLVPEPAASRRPEHSRHCGETNFHLPRLSIPAAIPRTPAETTIHVPATPVPHGPTSSPRRPIPPRRSPSPARTTILSTTQPWPWHWQPQQPPSRPSS